MQLPQMVQKDYWRRYAEWEKSVGVSVPTNAYLRRLGQLAAKEKLFLAAA